MWQCPKEQLQCWSKAALQNWQPATPISQLFPLQLSINSQLIASFQIKYAQAQEAHFSNIFLLTNNTDIVLDLQYYLKGIFNWKLTTVALGSFDMIYLVKMSYFCSFICSRQFLNLNSDGQFCVPPPSPRVTSIVMLLITGNIYKKWRTHWKRLNRLFISSWKYTIVFVQSLHKSFTYTIEINQT